MPQLDPTSFPSQLFWLTVTFVSLYFLLARFLLPRVQEVLTRRAWVKDSDITQAENMKAEAERLRDHYEKALANARAKSQALLAETQAAIATQTAEQQAQSDAMIEKKLAESALSIQAAKQHVADKLSPVSGDLASLIVELLVHHKPNAGEVKTLVNELTKEHPL